MSDTTQHIEGLLPCPFCGAQPEQDFFDTSRYPYEIYCGKCIGLVATQKETPEAAAAAWNRRQVAQPTPLVSNSELLRWIQAIRDDTSRDSAYELLIRLRGTYERRLAQEGASVGASEPR